MDWCWATMDKLRKGKIAVKPLCGHELIMAGYKEAMNQILHLQNVVVAQTKQITADKPDTDFGKNFRYCNVLCNFQQMANVLSNHGYDIGRNRLFDEFRRTGDIQKCDALFTQKALERKIGQNVPTGSYERNGTVIQASRAYLNYKGITEVFDRFGVNNQQHTSILNELDPPLSDENILAMT
jgi:phage antirepressor YoqD-like protein